MSPKPWLLYVRVSSDEQAAAGVSLEAQTTACQAYAVARGWTVAETVTDPGYSASTLRRPGMECVLAALRSGEVAGVIAWRLDRLTRSMRDLSTLLELAGGEHSGLVSVTESLDTTSPMGRFVVHLLGAIAQWERETIGARVSAARAHATSKGYWMGGPGVPAGCEVVQDGARKRLRRGADAATVSEAWRWVVAGASLREVAERLRAAGVVGPSKGWTPTTVRNLLLSPRVVGVLVDAPAQAVVRAKLAARATPMRRGEAVAPGKAAKVPSVLAGLLRCPTCSSSMSQVTASGNGGAYSYFRCAGRVKGQCRQKDLRCEPLERQAIDAVRQALAPGEEYHRLVVEGIGSARGQLEQARGDRVRLTGERDQLSARIGQLTLRMQIGSPGWDEAMKLVGGELARVDKALAGLQGVIAAGEVDAGDLDLALAEIQGGAAALDTATPDEQARLLRLLVQRVRIDGDQVELDLYQPKRRAGPGDGSYNTTKWLPMVDGLRTVRVRVMARRLSLARRGLRPHHVVPVGTEHIR